MKYKKGSIIVTDVGNYLVVKDVPEEDEENVDEIIAAINGSDYTYMDDLNHYSHLYYVMEAMYKYQGDDIDVKELASLGILQDDISEFTDEDFEEYVENFNTDNVYVEQYFLELGRDAMEYYRNFELIPDEKWELIQSIMN